MLGDEKKRSTYDTWGSTGNANNMGGAGGMGNENFQNAWSYSSNVDAEELFRKIFNQSGFANSGSFEDDFADSKFGFGAAEEVIIIFKCVDTVHEHNCAAAGSCSTHKIHAKY